MTYLLHSVKRQPLDIANVVTQKPVLLRSVERRDPWFTWESWLHVTLMKGSARMGYRSFFSAFFEKSLFLRWIPLSGDRRGDQSCVRFIRPNMVKFTLWRRLGAFPMLWRELDETVKQGSRLFWDQPHLSNLWCLKPGRNHRWNCSYHKQKWQHFLILQLLSSLSKKVLYRTTASQNTHLLFSFEGPDIFLPFTFIFLFISICLANL